MDERRMTVRITWQGPTPADDSILTAFVDGGADDPSIDIDPQDQPGTVRVSFGCSSSGSEDSSRPGLQMATAAALSLGELQQIDSDLG